MTYKVKWDKVATAIAQLPHPALHHWTACLSEIAGDPHPRDGRYVEPSPDAPFTARTFLYWITQEASVSGETIHLFTAEFFPEHVLVYVINEDDREVEVFYLRESKWA